MKAIVYPCTPFGTCVIPPSKSLSHRAITAAALASGTSIIENISYSKDILATIEAIRTIGAKITESGTTLTIQGIGTLQDLPQKMIDCNESGSTLRFLIPLFALSEQSMIFTGKGRLLERPQSVYQELFAKQGLTFLQNKEQIVVRGPLQAGDYVLEGNISSQFISGLLFALPLLPAASSITVKEPFESASYVELTIDVLKRFGIEIMRESHNRFMIKGNQQYQAAHDRVESDYSQAAFFAVLGALHKGITLSNLSVTSKQGDQAILAILEKSGIIIDQTKENVVIHGGEVQGSEIDLADCPDLGPILMVLGAFAKGMTHIYHAKRLRYKESDRIAAMETELKKLGVEISSSEDEIWIKGSPAYQGGVALEAHNDHRIVMSLAVATTLCKKPCVIIGAQAISKSYPHFFADLERIRGKVVLQDEN